MKCEIYLHNNYYLWENTKSNDVTIYHKGYVFIGNKLEDFSNITKNIIQKIEKNDSDSLKKYLNSLNGCFAVVIEHPNFIFASVDRIRSIPLFYSKTKKRFILSDDANYIRAELKPTINEINAAEFLLTGFVTGQRTLFDDIFQLQVGEYLIYHKNSFTFEKDFYFRFHHQDFFGCSEDELIEKLDDVMISVFKRLIQATVDHGKQIVVPLSGGIDSRLIVAMLKRLGVDNVLCFTYGQKNDVEVQISKKVADALHYKWHLVKHNRKMLYGLFHSKEMETYQRYAGNLISLPHIQDFFALYYLKNNHVISKDSVIVPGHTGMICGGCLPDIFDLKIGLSIDKVSQYCLNRHYNLWKRSDGRVPERFIEYIKESTNFTNIKNNEDTADFIEIFDFNERQAKFIVNSVRAYEYHNFEWALPLCDLELMNYFIKIPLDKRIKKSFYTIIFAKNMFTNYVPEIKDINCTTFMKYNNYKKNYSIMNPLNLHPFIFAILFAPTVQSIIYRIDKDFRKYIAGKKYIILPSVNYFFSEHYIKLIR
jgi:asparagine synthase (glutamine-hydrolysing)